MFPFISLLSTNHDSFNHGLECVCLGKTRQIRRLPTFAEATKQRNRHTLNTAQDPKKAKPGEILVQ